MSTRVAFPVITLLLAAVARPGFAQDGVGGRIGPAFTTFGGEADPKSKTGFIVSGFFMHSFGERVSVHPELSYVRKGASFTGAILAIDPLTGGLIEHGLERSTKLDYVELQLPIALVIPARRIGARVYGGPAVALELNCSGELTIETEVFAPTGVSIGVDSATESGGCADESSLGGSLGVSTRSLDFGLILGAGVDLRLGRGAITGDVRYDFGLADIRDGTGGSIKNRAVVILLGYAHYFSD